MPTVQLRPVLIVLKLAHLTPRKIQRRQQDARKFKIYANFLDTPPPPWGKGGVSKMVRVPEGEIFFTHHTRPVVKKLHSLLIVSI